MIEIIIFAIISFFVLKKLHSILGKEDETIFFDDDIRDLHRRKMKEAERVKDEDNAETEAETNANESNEEADEDEKILKTLSPTAVKNTEELKDKINGFTLNKFQEVSAKVLEMVIKANNDRDKNTIKKLLSTELADLVCTSFNEENKNNIILVECTENQIEDVEKSGKTYKILVNFKMKQINYTTDKDGNVIDGDKSEIVDVNEKWIFTHSIISNNKTWFVDKIEEC